MLSCHSLTCLKSTTLPLPPFCRQLELQTPLHPTQLLTPPCWMPCRWWTPWALLSPEPMHLPPQSPHSLHPWRGNLPLGTSHLWQGPVVTAQTSLLSSCPLITHFLVKCGEGRRGAMCTLPHFIRGLPSTFPDASKGIVITRQYTYLVWHGDQHVVPLCWWVRGCQPINTRYATWSSHRQHVGSLSCWKALYTSRQQPNGPHGGQLHTHSH